MHASVRRQRGIALPVMLIILLVMLAGSIYLIKSTNSTTLTTSNLAYEASLSKAADLGLLTGFQWLSQTAATNKAALQNNDVPHGYQATLDTTQTTSDSGFWVGSHTIDDNVNHFTVEYVVHRMCALPGSYDAIGPPANTCVQTTANTSTLNNSVAVGDSLASDASGYATTPQLHYVITARIFGPRGGNVVNQLVVMIGA
ncbi:MAG TPA: hypothetical protein VFG03_14125 [Telluria sp.]|nr:hypothetical protein [Telluria sp.]